jgi:O-antigen/teichoic acid export membrane protein
VRKLFAPNSRQWPLVGQLFVAAAGLAGATMAARLLGPQVYGEYFLGLTVVSVVGIAADFCVSQAILTRAPGYVEMWRQWRTLSLVIATSVAMLTLAVTVWLSVSADQIAMWFVLCTGIPVTIASMVPRAFLVLEGQLRFIAGVDVASVVLANALMLTLVLSYRNLAAAAAGQIIIALFRLMALELRRPKPASTRAGGEKFKLRHAFGTLWAATSGIYQSQLSGFISRNGDNLIVSVVLGPLNLAQYSRAYSFLLGPLQQAQMALTPMTLRDLSAAGMRGVRLNEGLKSAVHLLALMLPVAGVMAVCGERVVALLLGPSWHASGALMASSAGLAISMTVALPARWILIARRNEYKLRLDSLLQYALLLGVLAGAILWGLTGSMAFNALLLGPLTAATEWMLLPRDFRQAFLKRIVPLTSILTIVPAVLTWSVGLMDMPELLYIALAFVISVSTTGVALILLRKKFV